MSDRVNDLAQFMRAAKRLWSRMERDRQLSGLNGHNGHPVKYAMGEDEPHEPKKPKAETPKKTAAPAAKEPPISHPMKTPLMEDLAAAPPPKAKPAHPHVEAAHAISTKLGENAVPHLETIIANPETKPGVKRAAAKVLETLGKKAETPSPFPPDIKKMSGGQSPEYPRKPRVPQAAKISEGGRRIQDPNSEAKSSEALRKQQHKLQMPLEDAFATTMQAMQAEKASRTHPEEIADIDEEMRVIQAVYDIGDEKLFIKAISDNIPADVFNRIVQSTGQTPAVTSRAQPAPAVPNVARVPETERNESQRAVTPNVGGEIAPAVEAPVAPRKTQLAPPTVTPAVAQQHSPVAQQLTQAIASRAQQAVQASGLPPQYHAPFTENLVRVLDQMPEAALNAVQSGVGAFSFHASPQALAQSLMQLGGPVADRVEAIQQRGEIIGGVVHTQADGKQTVYLDGGRELHGSTPGEASLKRHGSEYYAHELGHILGATKAATGERHDASEAWEDIYSWEIGHTDALSKYATVSPKEAFAEFSRVLFSGLYDRAKLKGQFPRAYGYFIENGWVGDVEAERGGVKSATVFTHKVVLNRAGDHADISAMADIMNEADSHGNAVGP